MTTDQADTIDAQIAALPFDAAFTELRQAIEELEAGGLALEETIARTERARRPPAALRAAPQRRGARVKQLLTRPGGGLEARDLATAEDAAPRRRQLASSGDRPAGCCG